MANESRVYKMPEGVTIQAVAGAVESFLSNTKGLETQFREIPDGYVVQGREKKEWKTFVGMRQAPTVQMTLVNGSLNVAVGAGEWIDKIGAGAVGWFIAFPLAITAGVGAYQQHKLPGEIFNVIEQCVGSSGSPMMQSTTFNAEPTVQNTVAAPEQKVTCPSCQAQCSATAKFCDNCGTPLIATCPSCGTQVKPGSKFCPECGQAL